MDLHQALLALESVRFTEEDGRGPTRLRRAVIRHLGGWEEIGHEGAFPDRHSKRSLQITTLGVLGCSHFLLYLEQACLA